ncbi:formate dehydrogenase subunit delta [Modicisalibacter tunisiensis]|uniref:formate dehydrogenase subunit delta n=1 Tax=Modicisalibacter tunisiensis TaxID=390637 RepID=UPI00079C8EC1|nr:formate dehydrogenase subunit delta [Modicisalibacter tunisiensis]KXS38375.1 MAG: formate dehydrogenase subunit delta [Halomonadaceae bacterium T82-2]MBZ9537458.1 formate dehydrogenase subunit delta [Modicisalibacter tunisiensis]
MHDAQLQHLIKMVNQIAANQPSGDNGAEERVAMHLQKFWARGMKQQIIDYADQDGTALSPLARQAVARLKALRQAKAG